MQRLKIKLSHEITNHFPLILNKLDENDAMDEYQIYFKILIQKLDNKMPTTNWMETKNEIKIIKMIEKKMKPIWERIIFIFLVFE